MRKVLGIVFAAGAVIGLLGLRTAYAAGPGEAGKRGEREKPSSVAVAIGTLNEAGGDYAFIDFRGAQRNGGAGGNLRFYAPDEGYYNGGVRTLSVQDGVVKATGAGPLVKPDGGRVRVRYEAEFNQRTKQVTIKVEGKGGVKYTIQGRLDPGLIKTGSPG